MNEKVLCVPEHALNEFSYPFAEGFCVWFNWMDRKIAEINYGFKQIIPYIVLRDTTGKILFYQRQGNEKRLESKWSIGIGGHINYEDFKQCKANHKTLHEMYMEVLTKGITRELKEEVGIELKDIEPLKFKGIINLGDSKVDKVHVGMVFEFVVGKDVVKTSEEIPEFKWVTRDEILSNYSIESWTEFAIKKYIKELKDGGN